MLEPEAGNLFACRWAPGDDREQESFRIVEVAAISGDGLMVWAYGDSFAEPPSSVSVTALRRIRLHQSLGGPERGAMKRQFG